jgi:hypothetical protein
MNLLGTWLIIILIFGSMAGIELPRIIKNKQWREFTPFSIFLILGLSLTIMWKIFNFNFGAITQWLIMLFS